MSVGDQTTPFAVGCRLVKRLSVHGFIALFVGGWVRDHLMKIDSDDIDIATSASVEEVQRLFSHTIPVGVHFGIVIVVEEGMRFEVATFRQDQLYVDGRHPSQLLFVSTPREDAMRRDFTINGMFYDPLSHQVLDYVGGLEDLKNHLVRAIGDPHQRFLEDRLRMMRAIRYASRFQFTIEKHTWNAIRAHVSALFPAVSYERVWTEFQKMGKEDRLEQFIVSLHRIGLLSTIFPTLEGTSLEEVKRRCAYLTFFPPESPLIAKILELFLDSSVEEKMGLCDRFKLSRQERAFVLFHSQTWKTLQTQEEATDLHQWAHFYAHPSSSLLLHIFSLHLNEERPFFMQQHRERQERLERAIFHLRHRIPFLTSYDLRGEGVVDGKRMGELLREGERIAINENLTEATHIVARLKTLPVWGDFRC